MRLLKFKTGLRTSERDEDERNAEYEKMRFTNLREAEIDDVSLGSRRALTNCASAMRCPRSKRRYCQTSATHAAKPAKSQMG
jgi:hypothetical protein